MTECLVLAQPGSASSACLNYFDAFTVGSENLLPFERENLAENDFRGCCRPDGACGFMLTPYGLGCVSIDDMLKFTAIIPSISDLAPRSCFYVQE